MNQRDEPVNSGRNYVAGRHNARKLKLVSGLFGLHGGNLSEQGIFQSVAFFERDTATGFPVTTETMKLHMPVSNFPVLGLRSASIYPST